MEKSRFFYHYKKYYSDVLDFLIELHVKFSGLNVGLFLFYGVCLSCIEIERKSLVCGLSFSISFLSLINLMLSRFYLPKHKKRAIVTYNVYLVIFLILLILMHLFHPSHMAYTIVICSMITSAMTNMTPLYYGLSMIGVCILDIGGYFTMTPTNDIVVILGYILDNILVIAFTIGINLVFSSMKFKEFKQKDFLQNESYRDPLTQVYNRRYVEKYTEMNLEEVNSCAMFLIDVDNFKMVNDRLGHELGDEILCRISSLLKKNFRKSDCVARIGGDEFLILMPKITDQMCVENKVKKILGEFPIRLRSEGEGTKVEVSLSIGVVFSKPGEKIFFDDMYRRADAYMYKAKKKEKGIAIIEGYHGSREKVVSLKRKEEASDNIVK